MNIEQICKSISAYEKTINELLKGVVDEIAEMLYQVKMPDVKTISSSPRIVIVKASTVFSNSWNMSAEYYISESQTEVLIAKIRNKTSLVDIAKFIDDVILNGYIRINSFTKMHINTAVRAKLIEISKMLSKENE